MQVSDIAFGLLLLVLLSWTMIIALNQSGIAVVVNNIGARQQAIISEAQYCRSMPGFVLVEKENLGFKEYAIVPAFTDRNQLVLCVYEKKG